MLTLRTLCFASVSVAFALISGQFYPLAARVGPTPTPAAEFFSGVARVIDGDTIHVGDIRVRLEGIDAPESNQLCKNASGQDWSCGVAATHAMHALAHAREVVCRNHGLDKYGRTLGTCFVEGRNINMELVKQGLAWAYVKYSVAYTTEEADARRLKLGVWQGEATAPWDYRKASWSKGEEVAREQHGPVGCAIKGNVTANGHIYHMPWSRWYDKVRIEGHSNKRWFCSETEAQQAGWRPAYQ